MTSGLFHKLLANWPSEITHEHEGKADKELRYTVGTFRLSILQKYCVEFAWSDLEHERHVAYLHEIEDEDDLDPRMPESTKYEYVCGVETQENELLLFAYIWFDSLEEAKNYVRSHGMKILGGWGS